MGPTTVLLSPAAIPARNPRLEPPHERPRSSRLHPRRPKRKRAGRTGQTAGVNGIVRRVSRAGSPSRDRAAGRAVLDQSVHSSHRRAARRASSETRPRLARGTSRRSCYFRTPAKRLLTNRPRTRHVSPRPGDSRAFARSRSVTRGSVGRERESGGSSFVLVRGIGRAARLGPERPSPRH